MSEGGVRSRRVRVLIDEWFWIIALIAVLVAGIGGYAAYTAYANPGTVTEERQVSNWDGNGSYTTVATVSEPNPLYAQGTDLSGRPAYFMSVSPRLDGTFTFEYQASGGGTADVTVQQTLVLRAVRSDGAEATTEYWRIEESLDGATATDVSPGEPVRTTFSRNVSRVFGRASNVSERLGGTPGSIQIMVVNAVTLAGEINGQQVDRNATYRLPISVEGSIYAPAAVKGEEVTGSRTEQITRQRTYGPLWTVGGPAAMVVGLVGLLGLAYGRYDDRFTVSEAERDRLAFESTRNEFDDWITTASLPSAVLDCPRVKVDSLDGLVDTAIDVDARVFERPDGEAFYVTHEGLLYVYEPPAAEFDTALGEDGESDDETPAESDDA